MAFPSFFKCTGTPTADLFALLIRRPTEGEFVFYLIWDSTVDMKPLRVSTSACLVEATHTGGVKLAKNTKSCRGPVMGRRDRPVISLLTGEKTL